MVSRSLILITLMSLVGCSLQSDSEAFFLDGSVHRVQVETVGGDVSLVSGLHSDIGVEADVTWVGTRPNIEATLRGGVLIVKSPCLGRGDEPCNVDFTLKVPRGVDGQVVTRSGDLTLHGDLGPVTFKTRSGTLHNKR